jgi:hypothetical protein
LKIIGGNPWSDGERITIPRPISGRDQDSLPAGCPEQHQGIATSCQWFMTKEAAVVALFLFNAWSKWKTPLPARLALLAMQEP